MSIDYSLLNSLLEDGSEKSLLKIKCSFDVRKINLEHIDEINIFIFLKLFYDYYENHFKKYACLIYCVSDINQIEVLKMFRESFVIGFEYDPSAIGQVYFNNQIEVLKMFRESFEVGFKLFPDGMNYISFKNRDKAKKLFPGIQFPS